MTSTFTFFNIAGIRVDELAATEITIRLASLGTRALHNWRCQNSPFLPRPWERMPSLMETRESRHNIYKYVAWGVCGTRIDMSLGTLLWCETNIWMDCCIRTFALHHHRRDEHPGTSISANVLSIMKLQIRHLTRLSSNS